jgi:hypothetical protein
MQIVVKCYSPYPSEKFARVDRSEGETHINSRQSIGLCLGTRPSGIIN